MSDDINPYRSPTASQEVATPPRRTRWRIIAVTPMMIYGGTAVIAAPITLLSYVPRPAEYGGGWSSTLVAGALLLLVSGILWIVAAVLCWRGRWIVMAIALVLAIIAMANATFFMNDLERAMRRVAAGAMESPPDRLAASGAGTGPVR